MVRNDCDMTTYGPVSLRGEYYSSGGADLTVRISRKWAQIEVLRAVSGNTHTLRSLQAATQTVGILECIA